MPIKCIQEGCMKQPIYNLPSYSKALYCFEHKKENMILKRIKNEYNDVANLER
jgi:hypothetical protein